MKTVLVATLIFSNFAYAGLINSVKSAIKPGGKTALREADQLVLRQTEETMTQFLKLRSEVRTTSRDLGKKQTKNMYVTSENGSFIKLTIEGYPDRSSQVIIETNKRGSALWEMRDSFKNPPKLEVGKETSTLTFPRETEASGPIIEDLTAFVQRVHGGAYGIKTPSTVRSRKQLSESAK